MEPSATMPERDAFLWKQAKARVGFRMHLRTYLIVNAGLWLIWVVTNVAFTSSSGQGRWIFPWPIFPMLGWGIGLASHYLSVYQAKNQQSMVEEEYQKLLNRAR